MLDMTYVGINPRFYIVISTYTYEMKISIKKEERREIYIINNKNDDN